MPTFGVCLGHQCIGHVFGGNVIVNYRMMHGKTSPIKHNGKDLFAGMPNPFAATRYHSLVIERKSMPRLPGNHRRDRRGRGHGRAAQAISDLGRAVPPGKHPDRERPADPEELPEPEAVSIVAAARQSAAVCKSKSQRRSAGPPLRPTGQRKRRGRLLSSRATVRGAPRAASIKPSGYTRAGRRRRRPAGERVPLADAPH